MKKIRLLLADDHTLVRAGLRALLQSLPEVEVVAQASDGREALRLIKAKQPDIVLMDIAMPGLNGLEATSRMATEFPDVRVVILSMHATEEYVLRALQAGAAGYLLKDAGPVELELAVNAIANGETYLSPKVSRHVIEDYLRRTGGALARNDESSPYQSLTPRQREVLQLVAEGHTSQQIAEMLHISLKTVETHRRQIMARLDIHDLAGLVRYAVRMGLVTLE